jgi:hypothetical protein
MFGAALLVIGAVFAPLGSALLVIGAVFAPGGSAFCLSDGPRRRRSGLRAGGLDEAASSIFHQLADDYVLVDPSGGTCCRNECASCSFYTIENGDVTYAYEELTDAKLLPPYPSARPRPTILARKTHRI